MPQTDLRKLDVNFISPAIKGPMDWYDAMTLGVEGQGWPTPEPHLYCRLPDRAQALVRPAVWELSRHSAGLAVRFVADSPRIAAQWELRSTTLAMNHMAATGMSGIDLYVRDGRRWRFTGVARLPLAPEDPSRPNQAVAVMADDLTPGAREYIAYLPLYNGVTSVRFGVAAGSPFGAAPPRRPAGVKPICFYGTSIVQGGCASRPGMAYTAILGRRLDRQHINLGFSGNGKMEIEMARLLAELDPSVYVIDPLPNNQAPAITELTEPFIRTIRGVRPDTPIVMVENITYQQGHHNKSVHDRQDASNAAWLAAHGRLAAAGVKGLHYVPGNDLLGDDNDATVDGTHPTDLGFFRIANVLEPVLRELV